MLSVCCYSDHHDVTMLAVLRKDLEKLGMLGMLEELGNEAPLRDKGTIGSPRSEGFVSNFVDMSPFDWFWQAFIENIMFAYGKWTGNIPELSRIYLEVDSDAETISKSPFLN